MYEEDLEEEYRPLPFWMALLPIFALIGVVILDYNFFEWYDVRIAMVVGAVTAAIVGVIRKVRWESVEDHIAKSMKMMSFAFIFIMLIGLLIASWSMSGIVPSLVYYGMGLIRPEFLLVSAFLVSGIVASALGSSWTTMGTIGAALMAIATGLGYDATQLAMVAGAVISGAYLGDKISPLSDTTVLAAQSSNVNLWDHFRGNLLYSGIAAGIALVLYTLIGFTMSADNVSNIADIQAGIKGSISTVNPMLILPFLLIVPIVYFKLPAIPALFGLSVVGLILAGTVQGMGWGDLLGQSLWGVEIHTVIDGDPETDPAVKLSHIVGSILNRGSIDGQSWTLSLVMVATIFTGSLEAIGAIDSIGNGIRRIAVTERLLIASSTVTSALFSSVAGDQYVGLTVAPKVLEEDYLENDVDLRNLSRAAEDGGTTAGVLLPWTGCAATAVAALGVETLNYLPFAFFPILSIALGIILPLIGFKIMGHDDEEFDDRFDEDEPRGGPIRRKAVRRGESSVPPIDNPDVYVKKF